MQSRIENIKWHLQQMPMLRALLPIVVGVIIADRVTFPLWSVAVGFVLSLVVAWWWRARNVANLYLFVAFMLLGVMAVELRRGSDHFSVEHELFGRGALAEIAIERVTSQHEGVALCDARLVACRAIDAAMGSSAEPQIVNWPVRVVADESIGVQMGSRLLAHARIRPFDKNSENRYEAYMARRGVVGQLWLGSADVMDHRLSDKRVASWLHNKALHRIDSLRLSEEKRAVVEAMTIGERASMSSPLRNLYARSGSAHLLAVSGLHVGFVFAIINLLLMSLALFRHGQLIRALLAVVAIWIYAAVAGASPSVVRAAVMFSILQLAFALSARTRALNSLAFTACVMIVWDASLLYDAGFLLSFSAVAGIAVWGVELASLRVVTHRPFERKLQYKHWLRDGVQGVTISVWHAVAMSEAATLATIPLTAYMFGVVSLWSVVVGPLMILLGMLIVSAAMLWVLLPVGFLTGVMSWALEVLTGAMNGIAAWCSQREFLIWEGYIGGWLCVGCYLAFAIITLWLWSRPRGDGRRRRY
ncbi:MAG: ComEC/Rec2 family competence protein [Alistipes sp.]|nr:ComEC/Rec2 family competence protein [Alistipes sp.]